MDAKKHAYLIMAHNNFSTLRVLLQLLDDPRNDIYIHIDKKVKDFDFSGFRSLCRQARVFYPGKRIDVRWGKDSQVKTELLLFGAAAKNGPYHFYHLLSGVDLPLYSQNYIHNFFSNQNISYLGYSEKASRYDVMRISRYHSLIPGKGKLSKQLNGYASMLQERLQVDRLKNSGLTVYKGANWGSLTQQAVDYLLENKKKILKTVRFSVCADEVYKQTFLLAKGIPLHNSTLRLILWEEGDHPKILTARDLPALEQSDRLFARKFDAENHGDTVEAVAAMAANR